MKSLSLARPIQKIWPIIKVFADKQTDRQTDRQAKDYMSLIFRYGGIKIMQNAILCKSPSID
jgi:hypothetical protein